MDPYSRSTDRLVKYALRLGVVLLLLAGLGGLLVWFGLPHQPVPESGHLVTESHLAIEYDSYVGQQTAVRGTVRSVEPVVITTDTEYWTGAEYVTERLELELTEVQATVTPGDRLQVYGIVRSGGRIQALRTVVVPNRNFLTMYAISALAGVWALWRLGRGWTVDWSDPGFEPRTESIAGLVPRLLERFRRH